MNSYKLWLFFTFLLSISGCGGGGGSSSSNGNNESNGNNGDNRPPVSNISPTVDAGENKIVNEQTTVTLNSTGSDSDGTIVSYSWSQVSGPSVSLTNATTKAVSFETPTTTEQLILTFELEVTDDDGAKSLDTVNITVNPVNSAPLIVLTTEEEYLEHQLINLNAEGSNDEDGDIVSYFWEQTSGPNLGLQNHTTASVSFLVDDINTTTNYTLRLTVIDNENTPSIRNVSFAIVPVNRPPVAVAGPDQSVLELNSFILNGSASYDLEGPIVTYQWKQLSGPSINLTNDSERAINIIAPVVTKDEDLLFQLNVSDAEGVIGVDEVIITVTNVFKGNNPPEISGETEFHVNSGESFVFEPTVEDIDSKNLIFSWEQLAGTEALLSNTNTKNLNTLLPIITNDEELTFLLTVSADGQSVTKTFKLLVNAPPQIIIPEIIETNEQTNVVLDASKTMDKTNDTLTYSWQQTFGKPVTLFNPNTSSPSFMAPETLTTDASKFLRFTLTVTDTDGASSTKNITVNLVPVNTPPTIEFNAKNKYEIGEKIILNPTIKDEDGTVGTVTWNLLHFTFGNGTNVPTGSSLYKGYFVNDIHTSANEFKPYYTHVFAAQNNQPAAQLTFELKVTDNELEVVKSYHTVTFNSPFDVHIQGYEFEVSLLNKPVEPGIGDVFYENWGGTSDRDIILNSSQGLYWYESTNEGYKDPEYLNITDTTLTKLSVNDIDNDGDADILLFDPMKVSKYNNLLQKDLDEYLNDGLYLIENNQNSIISHLIITKTDLMSVLNITGSYGNSALLVEQIEVVDFDQDGLKDILLLANYSDSNSKGDIYFIKRQTNNTYGSPLLILQDVYSLFDNIGMSKGLYIVFTDNCPDSTDSITCENNYLKHINIYENSAGQLTLKDTIIEPAPNTGWNGLAGYMITKDYDGILLNKHSSKDGGYGIDVIKKNTSFDFSDTTTPLLRNLNRDLPFIGDINQDGFDDLTYVQIDSNKETAFLRTDISLIDGTYTTALLDSFPYPNSFVLSGMKLKESTLLITNPVSSEFELATFIAEPISYNLKASSTFSHSTLLAQGFHHPQSLVKINDKIIVASQCSNNLTEFNLEPNYTYTKIISYFTNPQQLVKGDFNEDGNEDFIALAQRGSANSCPSFKTLNSGAIYLFESNSDGTFKKPTRLNLNNTKEYAAIKTADLNSDGHLDLVLSGDLGEEGSVFLGLGNSLFTLNNSLPNYWTYYPFEAHSEIFDIDGDNDLDIVFGAEQGQYQRIYIYKNDGNGKFTSELIFTEDAAGFSPKVNIVAMDIENDGDIDIVGLKSRIDVNDNRVGLFVMLNTNGQFELKMSDLELARGVSFSPSSSNNYSGNNLITIDVNNDSYQDIITPSTFMLNNQQGGFYDYIITNNTSFADTPGPFFRADSIFKLDFDEDGDMDVIKTNNGRIVIDVNRTIP